MKKLVILLAYIFIGATGYSQNQNALNFDGVNDIITTGFPGIGGTGARTVEAWIRTDAIADPNSGGVQKVIADWGTFVTGGRFTFNVLWGNAIRLEVGGNGLNGSIAVNDGLWHHVAVTYNPDLTNKLSLYVDGELDVTGNVTVTFNTVLGSNLRIGRRIDNINHFDGDIDEVRVWNVALTQEELQENINNELCVIPEEVVAYYSLNEGIADGINDGITNVPDLSSNAYDGTAIGFSLAGTTSNWVEGAPIDFASTNTTIEVDVCDMYTWDETGLTYDETGLYEAVYTSSNDCDSIITLDLNVHNMDTSTEVIEACDFYPWDANGLTYLESGVFEFETTSSLGCDSLLVLDLTINESTSSSESVEACDSFFWDADGETYTDSGEYFTVLVNANGCDSMTSIDLTINSNNLNIIDNMDGSLTVDQFSETYQWLDCNDDYAVIDGETNQTLFPMENGSYAAEITNSGCTDTTVCVNVSTISIFELDRNFISIFPNPAQDHLNIEANDMDRFEIVNLQGQIIYSRANITSDLQNVELKNFEYGLYFVHIHKGDQLFVRKLMLH